VCLSDILDTGSSAGKEDISSDDAMSKEHNNDHGQITATSNSKALEDVSNVLLKLDNQHLKLKVTLKLFYKKSSFPFSV
jgi:hypothetical protein